MEYAYQADPELGLFVLLGSIARAMGKGWKMCVICDEKSYKIFLDFQKILRDKSTLDIFSPEKIKKQNNDIAFLYHLTPQEFSVARNRLSGNMHVMAVDEKPNDTYDLISAFYQTFLHSKGVTAITGTGKGKTTSALGIGVERILQHEKVSVIQWFKERKKPSAISWAINEHEFPQKLADPSLVTFYPTGLGFYGSPNMDRVEGEKAYQQHRAKAYEGMELARQMIRSGNYSLIILDEFVDTVAEIAGNIPYPLIDVKDMQSFLEEINRQRKTEVVVTGRRVTDHWEKYIGRSIVIDEVKHPWSSKHAGAISGLDF